MPATSEPDRSHRATLAFWAVLVAFLGLRLAHVSGPLDDPNSWRQVDTVHNALDFYHRGLDVLHPAVPWLGGHRTLVLDFPITPALSSLLYRLFGPSPVWDRVVSLVFFLVSAWHLHGAARFVAGTRVARLTTIAYFAFPLAVFYSRAPHIEFTVVAGVNGFLHHALRTSGERGWKHPVLAALWCALACLVKAPYLATVAPPIALALWGARAFLPWVQVALAMIPGVMAFLAWRHHADAVNARVPDWTFLPDFYKEVNPLWRWMGTMAEREDVRNWTRLGRRMAREMFAYVGVPFALAALLHGGARAELRSGEAEGAGARPVALSPRAFALAWAAGAAFHVLFLFRLNYLHNYYQTPLIAPSAFFVGLGADWAYRRLPRIGPVHAATLAFGAFLIVAAWIPPRLEYYRVDWLREAAGRALEARVPEGDLVITSDHNTLPPTDPRLLGRAHREGWPMRWNELTAGRVAKLRGFGARWVAIVTSPENPDMRVPAFLEPARVASDPVEHAGRTLGTLHLFELSRFGPGWAPSLDDTSTAPTAPEELWQHPPQEGGGS